MSEEEIKNNIEKFIDKITVILPDYSTKIPEYCIDEKSWLAIQALLDLYKQEKEKNKRHKERITFLETKIYNQKQTIKELQDKIIKGSVYNG